MFKNWFNDLFNDTYIFIVIAWALFCALCDGIYVRMQIWLGFVERILTNF